MPPHPSDQLPGNAQTIAGQRPIPPEAAALWEASLEHATRVIAAALTRCSGEAEQRRTSSAGAAASELAIQLFVLPPSSDAYTSFCPDLRAKAGDGSSFAKSAGDIGGAAYAAVPLVRRDDTVGTPRAAGQPVGTLLVVVDEPHPWSAAEESVVRDVAAMLAIDLELHQDLADHLIAEEELQEKALRDTLTGVPNSSLFLDRLAHALERGRRHPEFRFAVLALDLDRFQSINNSLGREAGNEVLTVIARRLESCVRGEDMIARNGGDEFAILLESLSDDSDGSRVAERMQQAIATPIETSEGEVYTSASIGIVLSSSGLTTPAKMLQEAGIAMSRAKGAGRNRHEMFDSAMHARALARLRMETDLRHAVERNEFEIYYQPLVTLETGRITELEALLRWRHPHRGLIPPLDFIPLAEETGLIVPIGQWVLARACADMVGWQERFPRTAPLAISVNLSPRQFAQPNFVTTVAGTVSASGLDPHTLKLEITESFAIAEPARTRELLTELRALGIQIYLDDFGTGYSSLGYLHQLPLDGIKIDRSFVMQMDSGPLYRQLVHTVRDLAVNIGVAAIAEGVENEDQLATLREMGCSSAQGYLFSRPIPVAEIEVLLGNDPRW
ncbi:MAG: putative bifunctional diguanylate cyclase/phosphodiesterase [Gemmatimonadaceae bacterium]